MTRLEEIRSPVQIEILIAFSDFPGFHKSFVMQGDDRVVFERMRDYFQWAGALVQGAGGTVVKCIGDAMMMAFPADQADQGVAALRALKSKGDLWLKEHGMPCQHWIKAHLGPVIAGAVGAPGQERFDVYGKTVNICATMKSDGLAISPQLFRGLSDDMRHYFKKHTLPVTYIRVEDAH